MTDTTTALAYLLPDESVDKINIIRTKYDRAVTRWYPHINFIFPFVPVAEFDDTKQQMMTSVCNMESFDVVFDNIDYFSQGKGNITFHLNLSNESEEKFQHLNRVIRECIPDVQVKRNDFKPHLTLGQCKLIDWKNVEQEVKMLFGDKIITKFNKLSFLHRNPESNDKMIEVDHLMLKTACF
jgi:2'-5' RNA ligase